MSVTAADSALSVAPMLELGLEVEVYERMEREGFYTLERFPLRRPDAYAVTVRLLQKGVSPTMVRDLVKVDIRTVNAVVEKLERENAITPYKKRTSNELKGLVPLVVDWLRDNPDKVGPIGLAVILDKIELLDGGATARVEHVRAGPEDALEVRLRALYAGTMREVGPDAEVAGAMGLGEGNFLTRDRLLAAEAALGLPAGTMSGDHAEAGAGGSAARDETLDTKDLA